MAPEEFLAMLLSEPAHPFPGFMEDFLVATPHNIMSRRGFCFCCLAGATFATTGGWLTPREAFAEARGLVSLIKDSAAASPITTHKLRNNISVLEGSGGNIAVPQITRALTDLGADPVT